MSGNIAAVMAMKRASMKASAESMSALKRKGAVNRWSVPSTLAPACAQSPSLALHPPTEACKCTPRVRATAAPLNVGEFPGIYHRQKRDFAEPSLVTPTLLSEPAPTDWRAARAEQEARFAPLGNQFWDEKVLCAAVEGLTEERADGCPCCGNHVGVKFFESKKRGVGGGHLAFKCGTATCPHTYVFKRSAELEKEVGSFKKGGAPTDANTARIVIAAKSAGMGLSQLNQFLMMSNIPKLNEGVWGIHGKEFDVSAKACVSDMILKNLELEEVATLLREGEGCRCAVTGKIKIKVMTDGSWQKRYGRNSLWGFGAMYGFYTGKVVFVASRCARCAVCMAAARAHKEVSAQHKEACTRDWKSGAASEMEKVIALEGVNFLFEKVGPTHRSDRNLTHPISIFYP